MTITQLYAALHDPLVLGCFALVAVAWYLFIDILFDVVYEDEQRRD